MPQKTSKCLEHVWPLSHCTLCGAALLRELQAEKDENARLLVRIAVLMKERRV